MSEGKFEVYSAELLRVKMLVQTHLIERLLGSGASTAEKINWIENNSQQFRELFDARKDDQSFLDRCISETELVVEEFVRDLGESDKNLKVA